MFQCNRPLSARCPPLQNRWMMSEKLMRKETNITSSPLLSICYSSSYILLISGDRGKVKERLSEIKEGVACSNFHASVGGGADAQREATPPNSDLTNNILNTLLLQLLPDTDRERQNKWMRRRLRGLHWDRLTVSRNVVWLLIHSQQGERRGQTPLSHCLCLVRTSASEVSLHCQVCRSSALMD